MDAHGLDTISRLLNVSPPLVAEEYHNEYDRIQRMMSNIGNGGPLPVWACVMVIERVHLLKVLTEVVGGELHPILSEAPSDMAAAPTTSGGFKWELCETDTVVVVEHEGKEQLGKFKGVGAHSRLRVYPPLISQGNWPLFERDKVRLASEEEIAEYQRVTDPRHLATAD